MDTFSFSDNFRGNFRIDFRSNVRGNFMDNFGGKFKDNFGRNFRIILVTILSFLCKLQAFLDFCEFDLPPFIILSHFPPL